MISQPELGKKIIELRRNKGLTQEELIDKCNISVRTLQRIEAGEVIPRNSTIRLIFEALEISHTNLFESTLELDDKTSDSKWYKKMYSIFIDLFNLRTKTLKKLSILIVLLVFIIISILIVNNTLSQRSGTHPQIPRSTGVK